MIEGDSGKLAAPLSGDADATQQGRNLVTESEQAREARVRKLPDAVDRVRSFRFCEDVFKLNL
ncbi:hypothetical protein DPMN_140433 [Dreissena polymorpha]|uniref:Uncharacterized protein n=1 Tax=Dreissena polymorpha TaxID=45954 RepID=A0A9D4GDI1_DREPO|nr:hypothetical protein DPMN_140433 [Dreissena polymorpha]